jgi:DNA-binding beta-propeller fold protein YncE
VVQLFLTAARSATIRKLVCIAVLLASSPAWASKRTKEKVPEPVPPELLLDGGRKLSYERSFSSEREVRPNRGLWKRFVDVVAGEPTFHSLVRPYDIAMDSRGRLIVTDPGAFGVHIFDFAQQKYKFLQRDKDKDPMRAPQCLAVDAEDNIYVTDSESGKIFVFDANGKFQRALGSLKGGEGYFKRPTGIAVDSAAQRIYVTDTLRNKVFMLDMNGSVLQVIGKLGTDLAQFNYPTELLLQGQDLIVVDAMNFRVQVLDRSGNFQYAVGKIDDQVGGMFRPKGIALDSEGHLYVVEGLSGMVQVFNREGRLLYYFGQMGTELGRFQLPTGLWIDRQDHIYVVDSFSRRVQIFHYQGLPKQRSGGLQ